MLGRELIIRDESIGTRVQSDVADEVPERLAVPQSNQPRCTRIIAAPFRACAVLAHQTDMLPTVAASKVTLSGAASRSMMRLNEPWPAVPSNLLLMGATTGRKVATATESSRLSLCSFRARVFEEVRLHCSLLSNHISRRTVSAWKKA
jgi:hypothetical protein